MNLKNFLTTPLQRPLSKAALIFLFLVTAIGFVDAAYLTVEHYMNAVPPCSIGSCEQVLTSDYATVLGIPVSLAGAIFYFVVLVLLMMYKDTKKGVMFNGAVGLITLGAVVSAIFICIQAFVLHAFCVYCMVSDTLSIILFIGALVVLKKHRTNEL